MIEYILLLIFLSICFFIIGYLIGTRQIIHTAWSKQICDPSECLSDCNTCIKDMKNQCGFYNKLNKIKKLTKGEFK